MKYLARLIQQSVNSSFQLWLLNQLMKRLVPFNRPHGFKIHKITPDYAQTFAPYCKKNFNHVRGIHACALATVGELAAGMILMFHFSPEKYRVILSHISIDYHYQAKKSVLGTAAINASDVAAIQAALSPNGKANHAVITKITDTDNTLIATVKTSWQVKAWSSVKTQV